MGSAGLRFTTAALMSGVAVASAAAADLAGSRPALAPTLAPAPATGDARLPADRFEVRLGVFAHDPWSPEKGTGVDVNGEVLSPRLFRTGHATFDLFVPRAHLGGTANFGGGTSQAYAGLTWTFDLTQQVFIEASLGGAVHNGKTGSVPVPDHNALGCSPLFRESASLGYRFTANWSVMASVEHLSNAGLCSNNRGLTNAGLRLGYSF